MIVVVAIALLLFVVVAVVVVIAIALLLFVVVDRRLTVSVPPEWLPGRDRETEPQPTCSGSSDTPLAAGHMHSDLDHLHRIHIIYINAPNNDVSKL